MVGNWVAYQYPQNRVCIVDTKQKRGMESDLVKVDADIICEGNSVHDFREESTYAPPQVVLNLITTCKC